MLQDLSTSSTTGCLQWVFGTFITPDALRPRPIIVYRILPSPLVNRKILDSVLYFCLVAFGFLCDKVYHISD